MITIGRIETAPYWIEIAGDIRFEVAPLTTALRAAAESFARTEFERLGGQDEPDAHARVGLYRALYVKGLGRYAIRAWDGVRLPDETPAPVTPENVDAVLDDQAVATLFEVEYTGLRRLLDAVKNASRPAPNGTSARAAATARAAPKPASPAPKAAKARAASAAATSRPRRKVSRSGKSGT